MKNFFKKYKHFCLMFVIVAFFVAIDIVTKVLTDGINYAVIKNFLYFSSIYNTGAAYGIFGNSTLMLTIVSSVMLAGVFVFDYFQKNKTILYTISISLVISGAVGNLIDRIFLGYVRDFIKMTIFSFTFNIADACLTVGIVLLIVFILFFDKKKCSVDKNSKNIEK